MPLRDHFHPPLSQRRQWPYAVQLRQTPGRSDLAIGRGHVREEFIMSTTVDLTQGAELHVGGATVGVFLPEVKVRELHAERDALRQQVEALRQELAAVERERDQFRSSLLATLWKEMAMDEEQCAAQVAEVKRDGIDFAEAVRQVEEIIARRSYAVQ
ncbi:MAG: hypothetical protein U0736_18765 [Gemmataceae bacterium]